MRAGELIRALEGLTVTQGRKTGERFTVLPWQRRFARGFCSTDGDVALTIARGAGKSSLIAGLGCLALTGPLRQRRGECICVGSSLTQARVIFEHVKHFLDPEGEPDRKTWRIQDTVNAASIEHRATGARVRCIGSDPRRAHGLAPLYVFADEPAQWEPQKRDAMVAALRTSLGKVPGSRMISLGTRPASEQHWFARELRRAGASYRQIHAAGKSDPLFHRRTWRKANPSLRYMPDLLDKYITDAAKAKRDPAELASFKALRLNMGTSDTPDANILLQADAWAAALALPPAEPRGPFVLGIDLGGSVSLSAAAAYWPETGCLATMTQIGDVPNLADRGLRDGVGTLYGLAAQNGELATNPGRMASVDHLLRRAVGAWGRPAAIVFDRFRAAELADAVDRIIKGVEAVPRGQGFVDGAEDVRSFRAAVLTGRVRPAARYLLLESGLSQAVTVSDAAANEKLSRRGEGGRNRRARDDVAAASILAVAVGTRGPAKTTGPSHVVC